MKNRLLLSLFLSVLVVLTACSGGDSNNPQIIDANPTSGENSADGGNGDSNDMPTDEPVQGDRFLVFAPDNFSRRVGYVNWFGFGYLPTSDHYAFEDEKVVLAIQIEGTHQDEETTFAPSGVVHVFDTDETRSIDAWSNNQISDYLMLDPAEPTSAFDIGDDTLVITSTRFLRRDEIYPEYDVYEVNYYVDNYSENNISIMSFNQSVEVFVFVGDQPVAERKTLSLNNDNVERRTGYISWNVPLVDYMPTRDFHIFNDEKMILEINVEALNNTPEFVITPVLHVFREYETASLVAWANNNLTDALMINPATPIQSIVLETLEPQLVSATLTDENELNGKNYEIYNVEYSLPDYEDDLVFIEGFNASATAAAEVPDI